LSSEAWTRDLAEAEAAKRGWLVVRTSWTSTYQTKKGPRVLTYDLFGGKGVKGIDMLCVDPVGCGVWGIQFTSWTNVSSRLKGCKANAKLMEFAETAGWVIRAWGFRIRGSKVELREEVVL
jgi:hypothetical protein